MTLIEYIAQPPAVRESSLELRAFLDEEIFFRKPESADWRGYASVNTDDALSWSMEARQIDGRTLLVFQTGRADPRLGEDFAGIPLRDALRLCFSFPGIDGVALVNETRHWKSFLTENFTAIFAT